MTISGKTQVYGVIGDPIKHSLSPAIQNAAFNAINLDAVFLAFKVSSADVENTLLGMRSLGIQGLNVTMPDKTAVIPFLDEVDETAKFLDSVNTIVNKNGKLKGFSTDGAGAHRALEERGAKLSGTKIVLLGAGGAARAVAFTLAREVEELVILSRSPEKNSSMAEALNQRFHTKVMTASLDPTNIKQSLKKADFLINATSVGMHPNAKQSLVERSWLNSHLTVMDIVYNPIETKLAQDSKAAGATVIGGIEMLVHQGAASFEIWTGKSAPVDIMKQAALNQIEGASKNQ